MKKLLCGLLFLMIPLLVTSQSVEVDGQLKVTVMDTINTENHLVVKRPDGTLATRMVASLPPPPDTIRTMESDLLLMSVVHNCPGLPPILIQSLLDNGYSIQELLDAGVTIQELLDAGATPIDLFNAGVVLDSLYGKIFEGGLIFYLDTITGTGLVAEPSDQSTFVAWGCWGTPIDGADGTAIGTGSQNTIDIVAGCSESGIAAEICANLELNGFDDWFLPSRDELYEMYDNIGQGAAAPNYNIGGFDTYIYWTSSEYDSYNSWYKDFGNGYQGTQGKNENWWFFRAVRTF